MLSRLGTAASVRLSSLAREKLWLTAGLTALFAAGWLAIPRWVAGEARMLPVMALEARVPFVEGFVYAYLSIVLFMPLAPWLTVERRALLRHGAGFAGLTLAAFACFAAYPVAVPVPDVVPVTALYALLRDDTRLNALPSLHVAYTVYSALYWEQLLPDLARAVRRPARLAVGAWATLIVASVLLTKQHYLVDVAAGAAVGAAAYALAFGRSGRSVAAVIGPSPSAVEVKR